MHEQIVRVAELARPVVHFVRRSGMAFIASGVLLWVLLFVPASVSVLRFAGSAIAALVLLAPGFVFILFGAALSGFVDLPAQLRDRLVEGGAHARDVASRLPMSASRFKPLALIAALYRLARAGAETKGMIAGIAGTAKLANPFTLAIVLGAGVVGSLELVFSVVVAAIRLF